MSTDNSTALLGYIEDQALLEREPSERPSGGRPASARRTAWLFRDHRFSEDERAAVARNVARVRAQPIDWKRPSSQGT
ncbi:hypothetical protein [Nonomuraea sp. B19D2]|uniref:hypothetical protein n=1 Tax=Nonomuraea sp. B19D2 TaxID=3159561 RepID=UPI0032DB7BFF